MFFFALSFAFFFLGLHALWRETGLSAAILGRARPEIGVTQVIGGLHELQETLEAGSVPEARAWQDLGRLPAPWGELIASSMKGLREQGGSVLPTLRRLRGLAERQKEAMGSARARSAQALYQALICGAMVPLFGAVLYGLIPGLESYTWHWVGGCLLAFALSLVAVGWLLAMAESARWGGLPKTRRPWILASQCAAERFLAIIRSGTPTDLAWTRASEWLSEIAPDLARAWGHSLWRIEDEAPATAGEDRVSKAIIGAATGFRKAIQVSLMEGRACTERIETQIESLRAEIQAGIDQEIGVLGTRALKPLFTLVAPALFLMLGFGLYLCWLSGGGVSF